MVIEYAGSLVRPTVADVREQRVYNDLVGAGTYVFRLNEAYNVDATAAGNMAHLLNHSCDPNCYSRTIRCAASRSCVERAALAGAACSRVALRRRKASDNLKIYACSNQCTHQHQVYRIAAMARRCIVLDAKLRYPCTLPAACGAMPRGPRWTTSSSLRAPTLHRGTN